MKTYEFFYDISNDKRENIVFMLVHEFVLNRRLQKGYMFSYKCELIKMKEIKTRF